MLPPKNPAEEKKHLQEHQTMMKKAQQLGTSTVSQRFSVSSPLTEAKKQKEYLRKKEENDKKTGQALHLWETDILTHWESR